MVSIKNITELYLGNFERPTTADGVRAYCDTLYDEGISVGKDLAANIRWDSLKLITADDGYYFTSPSCDSYLNLLQVIRAHRVLLGANGDTLTRAAALNFLCGVMDGINEVDEFSNVINVELYVNKNITYDGGACAVKFVIGDAEFDPEGMVRPVSMRWYQSLSKDN